MQTRARGQKSSEVCRTCMACSSRDRPNRKLVPIYSLLNGAFVANIIAKFADIQISKNDQLPASICFDCFETVKLLDAFIRTTRNSDTKLRQLCKAEQEPDARTTDADEPHFLEVKSEWTEKSADETCEIDALESENEKPGVDSESNCKASDDQSDEPTVKRKKLDRKSISKRRKSSINKEHEKNRVQSKDDLTLNEKEQELFTVIEVPPESHICCGCLQIYSSAEELEAHRKITHVWKNESMTKPSSKLLCKGCLRRYDSTCNLKLHQDRVRQLKSIWQCNKCHCRFKAVDKRRKHLKIHADDDQVAVLARFKETTKQEFGWLCCAPKCGGSYVTEKDLIAHAQETHLQDKHKLDEEFGDKPEQCQICFRRFDDRTRVVIHQRRLYKRKNMQCALCGLKFASTVDLNKHEVKEHGSRAFQCKICDKTFIQKHTLAKHVQYMHTVEKQYQCAVCGMAFRQKSGLNAHMSNHVEVPEFKCEVCSKMFKAKLHLRYHMRTHTGERPYKCRYCEHAFANHTNCRRHEMTHTGNKPHKCSYCEKSFIIKRLLIEHESHHTGALKFSCSKCNESFAHKSALTNHIKTSHVDNVVDDHDKGEGGDNDGAKNTVSSSDHETVSIGNRPVTIRVIKPIEAQVVNNAVQQHTSSQQVVSSNIEVTTSEMIIPAETVAVYNVVPTASPAGYSYILKF